MANWRFSTISSSQEMAIKKKTPIITPAQQSTKAQDDYRNANSGGGKKGVCESKVHISNGSLSTRLSAMAAGLGHKGFFWWNLQMLTRPVHLSVLFVPRTFVIAEDLQLTQLWETASLGVSKILSARVTASLLLLAVALTAPADTHPWWVIYLLLHAGLSRQTL